MTRDLNSSAVTRQRPDVDWMRALLVLGLTLFHSARVFDLLPFYVKNEQQSLAFMVLVGFVSQWGMPLFFVIAGIAAWHSLEKRKTCGFVWDRFRRLIVPLVFGLAVVVPPQHYYGLRTNPDYSESYWQFYPKFFRVVLTPNFPEFIRADPAVGLFGLAHLWFLYYLFVFSMLSLPLFAYLRRARGRRLVSRLAEVCQKPGAIFLLAIPAIVVETFVLTEETTGWNRYAYIPFLVCGFLFAADHRFEQALGKYRNVGVIAGTVTVLGFFAMSALTYLSHIDPSRGYGWESLLWRLLKSCSAFLWITAILGSVQRFKERKLHDGAAMGDRGYSDGGRLRDARSYINEAVMPFYIIHQTVIVVIAFYVVQWHTAVLVKYLLIVIATLTITFLIFVSIRRTNVTRVLFGMKLLN